MPKWLKEKPILRQNAYLTHEKTHYERQRGQTLCWLWDYIFDPSFRWNEEKIAYTAEFKYIKSFGCNIWPQVYKKWLLEYATEFQVDYFLSEF
jgi:hypothetical protein